MTTRTVQTWYAGSPRAAHATTVDAAIRAAVKRVLAGDYRSAEVLAFKRPWLPMQVVAVVVRKRGTITVTKKGGW